MIQNAQNLAIHLAQQFDRMDFKGSVWFRLLTRVRCTFTTPDALHGIGTVKAVQALILLW